MPTAAKSQPLLDLCGGHPALDLVNSLDNRFRADWPLEVLTGYGELLEFMVQTRQLEPQQVRLLGKAVNPEGAARALQSARDLREAAAAALYGILDGRPPGAALVRTLERHFQTASQHRELRWESAAQNASKHAGIAWTWGRFETEPDLPVWMLSQSVSDLMMSADLTHLRACGVETCRWLFLDTSKNHSRRWCDMKVCGNRMKARRFQARRED